MNKGPKLVKNSEFSTTFKERSLFSEMGKYTKSPEGARNLF